MFNPKDGEILPVLIRNSRGELMGTGISNEKGFRKSIERQEAWLLDGKTGRLLPAPRIRGFQEIRHRDGCYEIISREISADTESAPADAAQGAPGEGAEPADMTDAGDVQGSRENQPATGSAAGAVKAPEDSFSVEDGLFLRRLEETIRRRREEMPPGSYTTHLFEKGEEKIRKKTGEEAVELLLARDNQELASEAADLIYHMMVLFVQRGMKFGDAVEVLRSRHS